MSSTLRSAARSMGGRAAARRWGAFAALLLLTFAGCAGPERPRSAPLARATVAAGPGWLAASAAAMRAALTGERIAPEARGPDPRADLRATRDRVPADAERALHDDAWIGLVVTVRTGGSFVQGTAWARRQDRGRRWSALRRGTVYTGPPGPGPMAAMAAIAGVPSADADWGLPLAHLPEEVRDSVRELATARCELMLFDRAWAWREAERTEWVERCDEGPRAPEGETRVRVVALRLVLESSSGVLTAYAPVLEGGERLLLGPAEVRRIAPEVDPPASPAPPIAEWAARLGVRACLPRPPDTDLLFIEALGSDSFRVLTASGELRDASDEAALRRAFASTQRNHPDAPIRVMLVGCRSDEPGADWQQRAWAGAEVAARVATDVTGQAVAPCCP